MVDQSRCHRASRAGRIAGLALIWASVATITLGTQLQTESPRFDEYRLAFVREQTGPGESLNPAGRMALELSFSWQFGCCGSGFFALLFTAGVFGVRILRRWQRDLALVAAGMFGLGCLLGAGLGTAEALSCFHWGFVTLGLGYLLSAAGLGAGGVGVIGSCLWERNVSRSEDGTIR